ncbi:GerAB/ArcD/ProY family transporter [Clostridium sp. Mt-5]|uniref:GerAB/ArcD/ProY family transporter n=1 Tax=Clostridium moutaii TaxID=3240932 RepID=A0ABV4BRG9_9CLOT
MNKVGNNVITPLQVTFLLIGSMIGIGILSLPNDLINIAKQDAWISAVIGGVYPLYIVIIASLLCKRYPEKNILSLSRKCFGKFFGNVLNLIFLLYFVLFATAVAIEISMVLETLVVSFLSTLKILIALFFLAAYTSIKGLKVLARVNELMFLYTVLLSLILTTALSKGTYLNICPILGSGVLNIIRASKHSAFAYGGVEIILLIYPYITDKTRIMRVSLLGVMITAIIYCWSTFVTIYYLGIDIIPKTQWSVSMVPKTIEIPVINNFSFIFIILWSTIICKTISNSYFATAFILKDFFNNIGIKKIIYAIYPLMIYLSLQYRNSIIRQGFLSYIIPKYTLFNIAYITSIILIVCMKKDN